MVSRRRYYSSFIISICLIISWSSVGVAGEFDGSKPMLCSAIEVLQCTLKGCNEVQASEVNMPQFFQIDIKNKTVSGKLENEEKVTSKIEHEEQLDENLVVTGSENGMGWSIVVNKGSGKSVLSVSGLDIGFVVFGACTLFNSCFAP